MKPVQALSARLHLEEGLPITQVISSDSSICARAAPARSMSHCWWLDFHPSLAGPMPKYALCVYQNYVVCIADEYMQTVQLRVTPPVHLRMNHI